VDRINQYSEKVYVTTFKKQEILTFYQGVAGSNLAGFTINLVSNDRKTFPF